MAKSAVAPDHREWPEYEYREYPKHLGFDSEGVDIEVANRDEEADRAGDVVYPKLLGKDRNDKDVVAMNPAEETWKLKTVVGDQEPPKRGPGRPKADTAA